MNDDATIKQAINEFIWTHAPRNLRLDQAEAIAVKMFDAFIEGTRAVKHVASPVDPTLSSLIPNLFRP